MIIDILRTDGLTKRNQSPNYLEIKCKIEIRKIKTGYSINILKLVTLQDNNGKGKGKTVMYFLTKAPKIKKIPIWILFVPILVHYILTEDTISGTTWICSYFIYNSSVLLEGRRGKAHAVYFFYAKVRWLRVNIYWLHYLHYVRLHNLPSDYWLQLMQCIKLLNPITTAGFSWKSSINTADDS